MFVVGIDLNFMFSDNKQGVSKFSTYFRRFLTSYAMIYAASLCRVAVSARLLIALGVSYA